jgi:hypothetical protein
VKYRKQQKKYFLNAQIGAGYDWPERWYKTKSEVPVCMYLRIYVCKWQYVVEIKRDGNLHS